MKAITAEIRGRGLTRSDQKQAIARGLNRAGERGRTAAARKIVEIYSMKYGEALELLRLTRASADRLVVEISVAGRPLSLARFAPRTNKRTGVVTVDIKRNRKAVQGGFVRTLKSGKGDDYQVVFKRVGKSRYPLKALKTVDLPGVFSKDDVQEILEKVALDTFDAEYARQLELKLGR